MMNKIKHAIAFVWGGLFALASLALFTGRYSGESVIGESVIIYAYFFAASIVVIGFMIVSFLIEYWNEE